MMVAGKKIVELELSEKQILKEASAILDHLSDEVGNDDFDFEDLHNTLYQIACEDKFEVNFEQ